MEDAKYRRSTLPSYLKALLRREEDIYLVFNEKAKYKTEDQVDVANKTLSEEFDKNLDLTGSPLKIDLHPDLSISGFIFDRPNNWTDEEVLHHPISLSQARKYTNHFNREKLYGSTPIAIYCICDASDDKQTVIIGSLQSPTVLMRTLVFLYDCLPIDHYKMSVDYMKEKHLRNVTCAKSEIQYEVTSSFALYGHRHNSTNFYKFVNLEHTGSILLEVSRNKLEYNIPNGKADFKLMFQTIAGHVDSPIYPMWEKLNLLQDCIDAIVNQTAQSFHLSKSFTKLDELMQSIDMLSSCKNNPVLKDQNRTLDLNNLREETVLDKLWNILRKCNSVSNVQTCLHYLFEEMAEMERKIYVPVNCRIIIADIMNGINEGKLAVPNLSLEDSLEIFVELGLEVLKNDYLCLVDRLCVISYGTFSSEWNKLCTVADTDGNVKKLSKPVLYRKSRMTLAGKTECNSLRYISKLAHLARLHIVVEFILLAEAHCRFSDECLQIVANEAYSKYMISDSSIKSFSTLKENALYDLNISLHSTIDNNFAEKRVSWHLKMVSERNKTEITTIFHHSDNPLFPTSIFNNYDLSFTSADKKFYYVCELVQFSEYIGK